jgi:hypothetical protein
VLIVATCPGMDDPISPMVLALDAGVWSTATDRQRDAQMVGRIFTVDELLSAINRGAG